MAPDLTAPYKRFRPTRQFYGALYGGCFTADLMDCNWSCERCWSRFGGKGDEPGHVLTPEQATQKLVKGLRRNALLMCRITYGEPIMHWPHVERVIDGVLTETQGERMVVPGFTDRRGECMGIIIETNGSLLKPKMLDALETRYGADAKRIIINIGIKATTPQQLAQLTGHPLKVAERFHRTQLAAIMHMAFNCPNLVMYASFLDKFTDPEIFAGIAREVERAKPGLNRHIDVLDYVSYQNTTRLYTPKHLRERDFPDGVPADEPETVNALLAPDGMPRRQEVAPDQEVPSFDVDGMDAFDRTLTPKHSPHLDLARQFADAVNEPSILDGQTRTRRQRR